MKLAPLQLTDYFVHSIRVEALVDYDPDKKQDLDLANLQVTENCFPSNGNHPNRFAIDLLIKQDALEGHNLPYAYELHMVGFIEAHPDFPKDKLQRAVETNGPSMLFGAAREILRAATGRGPYGPVLIPSTTFFKANNPTPDTKSKKTARKTASPRKTK
jgi:preprotein translocase subunit SecB